MKRATVVLLALTAVWSVSAAAPRFSTKLPADKQILHALSRLTFGARPGDIDRVRAMGLEKWIDLQLHPERIAENPVLEAKLRPLDSLRMSSSQIRQTYPVGGVLNAMGDGRAPYPADPEHRRALELAVANRNKRRQLAQGDPDAQMGKLLEPDQLRILHTGTPQEKLGLLKSVPADRRGEVLDALNALSPNRGAVKETLSHGSPELQRKILHSWLPSLVIDADMWEGKLSRAIYSKRQLEEVLVDFWFNHFNVNINGPRSLITSYERGAIRPHVLGKFKDLLRATAEHPAMLYYLDNAVSVDPRAAARMGRQPGLGEPRGLNENYARELMELHTLGVDGGYTQQDIIDVARCLTGWTFRSEVRGSRYPADSLVGRTLEFNAQTREFEFNAEMHDPDEKTVLGVKIPAAGGIEDGQRVLDLLAHHPSTARFISRRLAQRFLADDPPVSVVQKMAQTFTETEGDIREVVKTMLSTPEFWSEGAYRAKMKSPLEMVVSAVRALDAEVEAALGLAFKIDDLGQPLYGKPEPTGYPNTSEAWINSTALLARMNFAQALAADNIAGVHVDLGRLGHTQPPDPLRVAKGLLPGGVSRQTRAAIATPSSSSQVVGLILGSPDFQRR